MPHTEPEAGLYLDRMIELRVFGRKPVVEVPPYSTDEAAAELVIARLNKPPLRWMSLKDGDQWTFHWRKPVAAARGGESAGRRYTKMITATAPTKSPTTKKMPITTATTATAGAPTPRPGRPGCRT